MKYLVDMSKKKGVDLASCKNIAHSARRNIVENFDKASSCFINRLNQITENMEPSKEKINDILVQASKSLSACIKNSKNSFFSNISCVFTVSKKVLE